MNAPPVVQYGRIYTVRGQSSYAVTTEGEYWGFPYSILIFSYDFLGYVYSTAVGNNLATKTVTGTGSGISVSGTTITFGSDSNRQYVVICPHHITLTRV